MSITIEISKEAELKLRKRADEMGKDFPDFIEYIVEREARDPARSWREIVAPIHERTRRLGLSEKDVEELVDSEIAAYRLENPLKCR